MEAKSSSECTFKFLSYLSNRIALEKGKANWLNYVWEGGRVETERQFDDLIMLNAFKRRDMFGMPEGR